MFFALAIQCSSPKFGIVWWAQRAPAWGCQHIRMAHPPWEFCFKLLLNKIHHKTNMSIFFLKKRTRTVYNTSCTLPFPNSNHCYTSQTVTRMVKTCFILHSSINLNIIKANLANCTKININFVILKYSFLVFYKKDFWTSLLIIIIYLFPTNNNMS